jgi:hypothetical protein
MARLDVSTFLLSSIASGYAAERGSASAKKDEITRTTTCGRGLVGSPHEGEAVADAEQIPKAGDALGKARMEAFSGRLAIAISLLGARPCAAAAGLVGRFLPDGLAYRVHLGSFLTVGAAWIAHWSLTDDLDQIDRMLPALESALPARHRGFQVSRPERQRRQLTDPGWGMTVRGIGG